MNGVLGAGGIPDVYILVGLVLMRSSLCTARRLAGSNLFMATRLSASTVASAIDHEWVSCPAPIFPMTTSTSSAARLKMAGIATFFWLLGSTSYLAFRSFTCAHLNRLKRCLLNHTTERVGIHFFDDLPGQYTSFANVCHRNTH